MSRSTGYTDGQQDVKKLDLRDLSVPAMTSGIDFIGTRRRVAVKIPKVLMTLTFYHANQTKEHSSYLYVIHPSGICRQKIPDRAANDHRSSHFCVVFDAWNPESPAGFVFSKVTPLPEMAAAPQSPDAPAD